MNAGLLVPADSELAQPIETSLEAGAIVGSARDRPARARDGRHRGLPRDHRGWPPRRPQACSTRLRGQLASAFAHEASVLRLLDGSVTPAVVEQDEHDGRPFLALSWCDGVDIHEAAAEARSRGPAARDDLLGLVGGDPRRVCPHPRAGCPPRGRSPAQRARRPERACDRDRLRARPGDDAPPASTNRRAGASTSSWSRSSAHAVAGGAAAARRPLGEQYSIAALCLSPPHRCAHAALFARGERRCCASSSTSPR